MSSDSDNRLKSALAQFTTPNLADALLRFGLPHGGHLPDIHMISPPANVDDIICAPAYTVRFVPVSDPTPRSPVHFLDTVPNGHFIVVDAPTQLKNAVWGGVLTAGAQARSAAGVVVSGRCRDLEELQGFPVFARGTSSLGNETFTRSGESNVPLVIHPQDAGIVAEEDRLPPTTVEPGDWIVADRNGVVCVPRALESQVIEWATKARALEDAVMVDIKAGESITAAMTTLDEFLSVSRMS